MYRAQHKQKCDKKWNHNLSSALYSQYHKLKIWACVLSKFSSLRSVYNGWQLACFKSTHRRSVLNTGPYGSGRLDHGRCHRKNVSLSLMYQPAGLVGLAHLLFQTTAVALRSLFYHRIYLKLGKEKKHWFFDTNITCIWT